MSIISGFCLTQGRVWVIGRSEWGFGSDSSDSAKAFLSNAMSWLSNGKESPRIASRSNHKVPGFEDSTETNVNPTTELNNDDYDIYCFNTEGNFGDDVAEAVIEFVRNGGSLLAGKKTTHI